MNGRAGKDGPEDVDAAFAEIVADLEREGVTVAWPDEVADSAGDHAADSAADAAAGTQSSADPRPVPEPPPAPAAPPAPADDPEDHFVPPDPPPLPTLRPATLGALALIFGGLMLLISATLFSLPPQVTTPFALVAVSAGIGWLVLRMRQGPPPGSGWDDGARL